MAFVLDRRVSVKTGVAGGRALMIRLAGLIVTIVILADSPLPGMM